MENQKFEYQLLSRLQGDVKYFLNGSGGERNLWAGNCQDQIQKMKELWQQLDQKPEWCTWVDILNYEVQMKTKLKSK